MYQWQARGGLGQLEGGPQCLQYIGPNCQAYGFGYPASGLPSPQAPGAVASITPEALAEPAAAMAAASVPALSTGTAAASSAPTATSAATAAPLSSMSSSTLWVLGLAVLGVALLMKGGQ
jgi:hypothetical protein